MPITDEELKAAYDKAVDIHTNHLISDEVKLPRWGSARGYWLAVLIHCSPDCVHKDAISEIVRKHIPTAAADQQVRHLSDDGWNLEGDGKGLHWIADPYRPHRGYAAELLRSKNLLEAGDFNDIKAAYDNKCVSCGAREGEENPRYQGHGRVKLQQGHKDPELPIETSNIIPQCQFCNQTYKDDFTFDDRGRVRAVASADPVLRASEKVKAEVMIALTEEIEKMPQ